MEIKMEIKMELLRASIENILNLYPWYNYNFRIKEVDGSKIFFTACSGKIEFAYYGYAKDIGIVHAEGDLSIDWYLDFIYSLRLFRDSIRHIVEGKKISKLVTETGENK